MIIRVVCGDAIKVMKKLHDNSYSVVITDPPYNLGKDYGSKVDDDLSHQEYLDFSKQWFSEVKRISKAILFTPGWNNLKMWLTEIEYPKGIVVWYNKNQMSHSGIGGWNHWEPILLYGKVNLGRNVFNVSVSKQSLFAKYHTNHPNPKPVKLIIEIIKSMTPKPTKVLDCFMGIGTTLIACKKLGIDCDGVEIEKKFVDEAKIYLKQTYVEKYDNVEKSF